LGVFQKLLGFETLAIHLWRANCFGALRPRKKYRYSYPGKPCSRSSSFWVRPAPQDGRKLQNVTIPVCQGSLNGRPPGPVGSPPAGPPAGCWQDRP